MAKKDALVSIIVCTYNRAQYLRKTLQSLKQLTYPNYEVIVVDNASTDDTSSVVAEFSVRYVKELEAGVSFARNCGLLMAQGDFVGFIDDDETVVPGWVEAMLEGFSLSEAVAAVTGPVYPSYEAPLPKWLRDDINTVPDTEKFKEFWLLALNETMGTGNSLFERRKLQGVKFRSDLGRRAGSVLGGEDSDFIQQLYDKGYRAAYSPQAAVHHAIPAQRLTYRYFFRRYFFEGITEYVRKGPKVFWRRLLKPVPGILSLLAAALTMQPTKTVTRCLRLCQTLGILYGPVYAVLQKRR